MQQFTVRLWSFCSIFPCQIKTNQERLQQKDLRHSSPIVISRSVSAFPNQHPPLASPGTCCCNSTASCKPRARPPPLPPAAPICKPRPGRPQRHLCGRAAEGPRSPCRAARRGRAGGDGHQGNRHQGGAGGAAGAGAVTAPCVSRCVMTSATPAPRTAARGGALPPAPAPPRLRRALRRRWTRLGRQDLLDRQLPGAAGHRLAATCEAPRLPPLHRPSERSLGASAAPRAGPSGRGAGSGAAHGGPGARLSRRSHPRRQRGVPGRPGTPSPRGPSCAPRRAAAAGPSRPPAADREGRVAGGASARVGATA